MKALTVATPDMMECAFECAGRAKHYADLDVSIKAVSTAVEAHQAKLDFITKDGYNWFIDADYWFVRGGSLPEPSGNCLIGAPNNTPNPDKYYGRSVEHLICTCFFGMDRTSFAGVMVPHKALELWDGQGRPAEDERFINIAAIDLGIPILRFSTDWNWCGENPPKSVRAIHAAGRTNKYEWLKKVAKSL